MSWDDDAGWSSDEDGDDWLASAAAAVSTPAAAGGGAAVAAAPARAAAIGSDVALSQLLKELQLTDEARQQATTALAASVRRQLAARAAAAEEKSTEAGAKAAEEAAAAAGGAEDGKAADAVDVKEVEAHPEGAAGVWPEHPPVYICPDVLLATNLAERGGSRGFVAKRALPAGTLILSERAAYPWPRSLSSLPELAGLASMLGSERRSELVRACSQLHPRSLEEADEELVDQLAEAHAGAVEAMLEEESARESRGEIGAALTRPQLLRLLFSLRCNAFASGLYLHMSMWNHSCVPNCVKFSPGGAESSAVGDAGCSEVWTQRAIEAGEELTISYLRPRLLPQRARARRLRQQFMFDCDCPRCSRVEERSEALACVRAAEDGCDGRVPPEAPVCDVCGLDQALEAEDSASHVDDIASRLMSAERLLAQRRSADAYRAAQTVADMAAQLLHSSHLLWPRLHSALCAAARAELPSGDAASLAGGRAAEAKQAAVQLLRHALALRRLQLTTVGCQAAECATACDDAAAAVQALLGLDKAALAEEVPALATLSTATTFSHVAEEERDRLRKLYTGL
eukprot:PLAT15505.7.p1 GENE.PLAT15505.7~~PLAT15505.7.p1  ORF type:complete len:572 (-),score=264.64 PLAT15505.7:5-1720(-)